MSALFDTVVVGTSLRPESESHVRAAVALARQAGARVELVHALQSNDVQAPGLQWLPAETWISLENEIRRALYAQAARTGLDAAEIRRSQVLNGAPHRVLAAAASGPASLLVVGATESSRRILGTTAERVVRLASRPTLVLREGWRPQPRRIVVPVDFSPLAAGALRTGMVLAEQLGWLDRDIEAVFVLPPWPYGASRTPSGGLDRAAASDGLARFVMETTGPCRVGETLLEGDPASAICARLAPDDLVVLGTHGQSGFERFLLGSVAAQVLRSACSSVLLVPPHAAARTWMAAQTMSPELVESFHRFG